MGSLYGWCDVIEVWLGWRVFKVKRLWMWVWPSHRERNIGSILSDDPVRGPKHPSYWIKVPFVRKIRRKTSGLEEYEIREWRTKAPQALDSPVIRKWEQNDCKASNLDAIDVNRIWRRRRKRRDRQPHTRWPHNPCVVTWVKRQSRS